MTARGSRLRLAAAVLAFALVATLEPAVAQLPSAADDRFAGLQWRFVRIKYHYTTEGTRTAQEFYGEPWAIDAPAAEQNLSRRLRTATAIEVGDPVVISLDDPRLFTYPWIYIVEPGNLKLGDADAARGRGPAAHARRAHPARADPADARQRQGDP